MYEIADIWPLLRQQPKGTSRNMQPPEIFDRAARRAVRKRAAALPPDDSWLIERMASELTERLNAVNMTFGKALIIGDLSGILCKSLQSSNVSTLTGDPADVAEIQFEEDLLPFASGSFDVILAISTLDTVNDLPGALLLLRRALAPGGLFLAAFNGAGSMAGLRRALTDAQGASSVARMHPGIDVRTAGDLLIRAGFSLPVADGEAIPVRYSRIDKLFSDLRANALVATLKGRPAMGRQEYLHLKRALSSAPFEDQFNLIYLTGWSPVAKLPE